MPKKPRDESCSPPLSREKIEQILPGFEKEVLAIRPGKMGVLEKDEHLCYVPAFVF